METARPTIDRFAVRKDSATGLYGVWDAAVNGWRSAFDLDEPTAASLADQMNAKYEAELAFPGHTTSRRVEPPRRVLIHVNDKWWPGRLDWWVRETDGWFGRAILDAGGPSNWYPANALRPASS